MVATLPAEAAELKEDGPFQYYLNDRQEVVISKYTGNAEDVLIPEAFDGKTTVAIGEKAFYKCEGIKSILFPDTVAEIGDYAFYGCKGLGMIRLPPMLEAIGRWAFVACDGIEYIVIPPGVGVIGAGAFSACKKLGAILVQKGNPVFQSVDGVLMNRETKTLLAYPQAKPGDTVTVEAGTRVIAPRAFVRSDLIRQVILPSSLEEIGESAFSGCPNLEQVNLPKGLKTIGLGAFYWCQKLEVPAIPSTVESIMPLAFSNCLDVASYLVEEANPFFESREGALYNTLTGTLIAYPPASPAKAFSVPEGTKEIGQDAFMNCTTLEEISLPEGLETIGQDAFRNCDGLKTLDIPPSVQSIGPDAFTQWKGILTLRVREGSPAHQYAKDKQVPFEILP